MTETYDLDLDLCPLRKETIDQQLNVTRDEEAGKVLDKDSPVFQAFAEATALHIAQHEFHWKIRRLEEFHNNTRWLSSGITTRKTGILHEFYKEVSIKVLTYKKMREDFEMLIKAIREPKDAQKFGTTLLNDCYPSVESFNQLKVKEQAIFKEELKELLIFTSGCIRFNPEDPQRKAVDERFYAFIKNTNNKFTMPGLKVWGSILFGVAVVTTVTILVVLSVTVPPAALFIAGALGILLSTGSTCFFSHKEPSPKKVKVAGMDDYRETFIKRDEKGDVIEDEEGSVSYSEVEVSYDNSGDPKQRKDNQSICDEDIKNDANGPKV